MLGLRTTIYKVENLEDAKAWYAKAFGLFRCQVWLGGQHERYQVRQNHDGNESPIAL